MSGDELSDNELDKVLAAVHDELLSHANVLADPARALIAIMAEDDVGQVSENATSQPAIDDLASQRLLTVVAMRCRATELHRELRRVVTRARDLAAGLDRELHEHYDLAIAVRVARTLARRHDRQLGQVLERGRDLAIAITYDLTRIRCMDRDLSVERDLAVVRELSLDIDHDPTFEGIREHDRTMAVERERILDHQISRARELSIDLDRAYRFTRLRERPRELDRARARDLAHAIDAALVRACDLAADVMCRLNAWAVDASGADLSRINLPELSLLTGVIWTDETSWPASVIQVVEKISCEVGPGTYQIRSSSPSPGRGPGRHAARQLPVGR